MGLSWACLFKHKWFYYLSYYRHSSSGEDHQFQEPQTNRRFCPSCRQIQEWSPDGWLDVGEYRLMLRPGFGGSVYNVWTVTRAAAIEAAEALSEHQAKERGTLALTEDSVGSLSLGEDSVGSLSLGGEE